MLLVISFILLHVQQTLFALPTQSLEDLFNSTYYDDYLGDFTIDDREKSFHNKAEASTTNYFLVFIAITTISLFIFLLCGYVTTTKVFNSQERVMAVDYAESYKTKSVLLSNYFKFKTRRKSTEDSQEHLQSLPKQPSSESQPSTYKKGYSTRRVSPFQGFKSFHGSYPVYNNRNSMYANQRLRDNKPNFIKNNHFRSSANRTSLMKKIEKRMVGVSDLGTIGEFERAVEENKE